MSIKLLLRLLCVPVYSFIVEAACKPKAGYITAEDCTTQKSADTNARKACTAGVKSAQAEVEKTIDKRRTALWSALGAEKGDNLFVNVVTQSAKKGRDTKTKADGHFAQSFQDNFLKPNYILQRSWPLGLAIFLAVLWWCFCWTIWPCCKCCRVCRKKDGKYWGYLGGCIGKLVALIVLAGFGVALVIAGALTVRGHDNIVGGFNQVSCTAADLLNTTLAGSTDPKFLGMFPLLEEFGQMSDLLTPTSKFMKDIKKVLDETKAITTAIDDTSASLKLISESSKTVGTEVAKLKYECQYCTKLSSSLDDTTKTLDGSVGMALKKAREQVETQLQSAGGKQLKSTLDTAAKPLISAKDMTRKALKLFSGDENDDGNMVLRAKKVLGGRPARGGVVGIVVLALLLWIWSCADVVLKFICCTDPVNNNGEIEKQPNLCPICLAGCCFCCGWPVALLAFVVGGLFMVLSIPTAGVCLLMDPGQGALNKATLTDLMSVMNMSTEASQQENMFGIIDNCFVGTTVKNPNLLDVIKTDGSSLRVSIVDKVKTQIDGAFKAAMSGSVSTKLADDKNVKALTKMIKEMPIEALILPTSALIKDKFPLIATKLTKGPALNCNDVTYENKQVTGVVNWAKAFGTLNTYAIYGTITTNDCKATISCSAAPASPTTAQKTEHDTCKQAEAFIKNIQTLRKLSTYKCGAKNCADLTKHEDWFSSQSTVVGNRFSTIDSTVKSKSDKIKVTLKAAVQTSIIDPIDRIAAGATCGFLAKGYKEFINGLCFQAVYGLSEIAKSYVVSGVFATAIFFYMYWFWRYIVDNHSSFKEAAANSCKAES